MEVLGLRDDVVHRRGVSVAGWSVMASAEPTGEVGLGDLVAGVDPLECPACVELGDACRFHAGFAAGWDACAAFVAAVVEQRDAGPESSGVAS